MSMPTLVEGCDLLQAKKTLEEIALAAANVVGAGGVGALLAYLEWEETTERRLVTLLARDDVAGLLQSPRHWTLRNMSGGEPRIFPEVQLALDRCTKILRDWAVSLGEAHERWSDSVAVVPDTNYLLHCGKRLPDIDWQTEAGTLWRIRVVLTVTVLDEIDRHKRSAKDGVRATARQVFKDMGELGLLEPDARVHLHNGHDPQQLRGTIEVLPDALDHVRLPDADSEIVSRAEYLSTLTGRKSIVLTYDAGMAARTFLPNVDVLLKTQPGS